MRRVRCVVETPSPEDTVRLRAARPSTRPGAPALTAALAGVVVAGVLVVGGPLRTDAATPTCHGLVATVVGTSGADDLVGTSGDDVIAGLTGDDTVAGGGGDDVICGGRGTDRLFGDEGDDELYGNGDRLDRDPAGSFLVGDTLVGGQGQDLLVGGPDGRDADQRRRPDTVSFTDAPRGVEVVLPDGDAAGTATGYGPDTIAPGVPWGVWGSPYDDVLTGSGAADVITGGAGDDELRGGGGSDRIYAENAEITPPASPDNDVVVAGRGNDYVSSLGGRDQVQLQGGDDYAEAFSAAPSTVSGGLGSDRVSQNLVEGAGLASDGGPGLDRVTFFGTLLEGRRTRPTATVDQRSGTLSVDVQPAATGTVGGYEEVRLAGDLAWVYIGLPVGEKVWGISGGPLRAHTLEGDDVLVGTPRDDRLVGGAGDDQVQGNGGADFCRATESGSC